MSRGSGNDHHASSSGLLFGPRRLRPEVWSAPEVTSQGKGYVRQLLAHDDLTPALEVLAEHHNHDLSQAPNLALLVGGLTERIASSERDNDQQRALYALLRQSNNEGGGQALASLVPPLLDHSLATISSPQEELSDIAALAQDQDTPLGAAVVAKLRELAQTPSSCSWQMFNAVLLRLDEQSDSPSDLVARLARDQAGWPLNQLGRAQRQAMLRGQAPELVDLTSDTLKQQPFTALSQMHEPDELAAADPALRQRLEQSFSAWIDDQRQSLDPAATAQGLVDNLGLAPLDAERERELSRSLDELAAAAPSEILNHPPSAEERISRQAHQAWATALAPSLHADLDGCCARLARRDADMEENWLALNELVAPGQLQRRLPEAAVQAALVETFAAGHHDGEVLTPSFSGNVFLLSLIDQLN